MKPLKPLHWIGKALADLKSMPIKVKDEVGYALYEAQEGKKSPDAKPLKGFMGAGVLEVVSNHDGDTYRAVYTVKFKNAVYALHVFQKKSKRGISTPKQEIDMIKQRLKQAQKHYEG